MAINELLIAKSGDRYYFGSMEPKRNKFWYLNGMAKGFSAFAFRISLVFAVIGVGFEVYELFGAKWFYVYVFAAIAVRLHFDLAWIEKNHPNEDGVQEDEKPENPFRKR